MLPGMNGFEVCRTLRPERPDLWIIMLTVSGQEVDRVTGFEAGADDYVTKPFSLRELVGRIKVGLRRANGRAPERRETFGAIEVDLAAHRVSRAGEEVELTPKEFEILALLSAAPERPSRATSFWTPCGARTCTSPIAPSTPTCRRSGASSKTTPIGPRASSACGVWGTASREAVSPTEP